MNNGTILPGFDFLTLEGAGSLLEVFLKLLYLSGFLIYVIFAFMVIRQTTLMEDTYKTPLGPALKIFAIAHFLVALGIFVLVLMVL